MSNDDADDDRVPVTILSGFLGAGKTTLLRYILESHEHKQKVAVIVNDMASLNIDAAVVGGDFGSIVQAKKEVVSLSNGCICCALRGDLIREINRIRKLGSYDYILIESTGVAEPQQVAESFCADPETQDLAEDPSQMLWNVARLDTCVTVLDAKEFPRLIKSVDRFKDLFTDGLEENDPDGEGEKNIADLLIEQVEFANVILVNKVDLVSEEEREQLVRVVSTLNPKAKILCTSYSKVDLKEILNSHLFSMEEAQMSAGWLDSLKESKHGEIKTETDEYNISSFVYRARKPFHPTRLSAWIRRIFHFSQEWNENDVKDDSEQLASMESNFGQILRSKGFCWIAGRDNMQASWSNSGRLVLISPMMPWCAVTPEKEWVAETPEEVEEMRKNFEGPYDDRRQAIVFIGIQLKKEALISSLNECLLTDAELTNHSLTANYRYHDTLPAWLKTYEEPGETFCPILQVDQRHRFEVAPGLLLRITNLALDIPIEMETDPTDYKICAKIWLDQGEGSDKESRLLATLRSGFSEQYSLAVEVASKVVEHEEGGDEEEEEHEHDHVHEAESTVHWLRMELITRATGKRSHTGETLAPDCEGVRVHALGSIMLHPSRETEGEEDNEDEENGEACALHGHNHK